MSQVQQHTPGPWRTTRSRNNHIVTTDDGSTARTIARVVLNDEVGGEMPVSANARLIAAAPELLEACKAAEAALVSLLEMVGRDAKFGQDVVLELREKIARAEGGAR